MSVSIHATATSSPRMASHTPYADIAVAMTGAPGDAAALDAAATLARAYGGRLDVLQLLVMPAPFIDAWGLIPDAGFGEVYADMREAGRKSVEVLRSRLAELAVPGDVRLLEALCVEPSSLAAMAVRRNDLVVMATPYRAPLDTSVVHAYFAGLLLESGRSVLLVPSGKAYPLPPRRVLVAWSDTPEAARAVHDAIPFLRTADSVEIVTASPTEAGGDDDTGKASLVGHLARHGVKVASATINPGPRSTGMALIDHATRIHADLIVAGGYGHGRFREWALGGTTRDLFLEAAVPVLLSH
jgi:nucleotide-binding universal stress UspA family protein